MCCFGSYLFLSQGGAGGLDLSKHVIIHDIFTDGISGEYPSDVLKTPKVTGSNDLLRIQIVVSCVCLYSKFSSPLRIILSANLPVAYRWVLYDGLMWADV